MLWHQIQDFLFFIEVVHNTLWDSKLDLFVDFSIYRKGAHITSIKRRHDVLINTIFILNINIIMSGIPYNIGAIKSFLSDK